MEWGLSDADIFDMLQTACCISLSFQARSSPDSVTHMLNQQGLLAALCIALCRLPGRRAGPELDCLQLIKLHIGPASGVVRLCLLPAWCQGRGWGG